MELEQIGIIAGMTIAVLIFVTYLLGDNVIYRVVLGLLVGTATGYALGIAVNFILAEWLTRMFADNSPGIQVYYGLGLLFGALLILKGIPRLAHLANPSMGLLLGVGAAVAVSGALLGTLLPQAQAAGMGLSFTGGFPGFAEGLLGLVGTVLSLLVFSPLPRQRDGEPVQVLIWLQRVGRAFIVIALAVAFAGALTSALTMLVERSWLIKQTVEKLLLGG